MARKPYDYLTNRTVVVSLDGDVEVCETLQGNVWVNPIGTGSRPIRLSPEQASRLATNLQTIVRQIPNG